MLILLAGGIASIFYGDREGIILILLPLLMLYFLIKTKFGMENNLDNQVDYEIKKVEHEIKKARLLNENCLLKKELDKLC